MLLLGLLVALCACSEDVRTEEETSEAAVAEVAREAEEDELIILDWSDLLPEGEEDRLIKLYEDFYSELDRRLYSGQPTMMSEAGTIQEGSSLDEMPQLGTFNTVDALNGKRVEIPGFVVPLDMSETKVTAFLIVPYFGACIHTPPPAPNQIIYATADTAEDLQDLFSPRWFTGILETNRQETDLGNAAYTLRLEAVRLFE